MPTEVLVNVREHKNKNFLYNFILVFFNKNMKFNLSENVPKSVISINQNIHPLTVFLTTIVGYPYYIMNSQTHYLYLY